MNRYFNSQLRAVVRALFVLSFLLSVQLAAHAARQAGAPRVLAVRFSDDLPLMRVTSSLSNAAVGSGAIRAAGETPVYPLYFTRNTDGARNLYRAELQVNRIAQPGSEENSSSANTAHTDANTRFVTSVAPIIAAPITRLSLPSWADKAVPLPDGRSLLCVTNSLTTGTQRLAGFDQIVRLDLRTGAMRALTNADARHGTPSISPDGRAFAYHCDRSGSDAVYVAPIDLASAPGVRPQRIARSVRRPVWLDDRTLVVERIGSATGLGRLDLASAEAESGEARLLWARGGQSAFDGRLLCVAAPSGLKSEPGTTDGTSPTRLYLLAADGSGARAMTGTDGAASPAFAPDGSFILFDAPQSAANQPENKTLHSLWLLPMRRVAPIARLDSIRAMPGGGWAIVGTAFSNDNAPRASLEWGEGRSPQKWNSLPATAPTHSAILARWTPPSARGEWTLRLRVEDAEGDSSESQLPVVLPLRSAAQPAAPPIFASPVLSLPPGGTTVPFLPLPALPPAPFGGTPQAPRSSPLSDRAPEAVSARPSQPPLAPRATPRPAPRPLPVSGTTAPPVAVPSGVAPSQPTPRPTPTAPAPAPAPPKSAPAAGDAAVLTVGGIPYSVQPGETLNLSASMRNTGTNGWKTSGSTAVRLLVRWHDAKTGGRTRWAVRWLRSDVVPGGVGKLDFTVPAPTRAGDYILRFSLVRVGPDGYTPPPFSQRASERYPGEFGVATTTMPVRP